VTILLAFAVASCSDDDSPPPETQVTELSDYETLISYEDELLGTPTVIRYAGNSTLFVTDLARMELLEIKTNGEIVRTFAGEGRGPGEVLWINTFYLYEDHVSILDPWQFLIHIYERNGSLIHTFNYGEMGYTPFMPSPPVTDQVVRPPYPEYQPHMTANGDVLLSPAGTGDDATSLYRIYEPDGSFRASVGDIPEGSTFRIDNDLIREEILDGEIPSFYLPQSFPVTGPYEYSPIWIVNISIPKVSKYSPDGEPLWSNRIKGVPEFESMHEQFISTMERMTAGGSTNRIGLTYYYAGVASPDGELYLIADPEKTEVHRFDPDGNLTHRYRLIAEDDDLQPIFDVDFEEERIFVVSDEGDIRAYSF
jgi:hypothetical protein